jgi:peptidoglycan biosynthesis protein MviN/MurJ (putative lipid II flippase)
MKTPLRVSIYTVCLNAILNVLAIVFLPTEWRHVGLAVSTVICSACGIVLLVHIAHRRSGSIGIRRLVNPVAKILIGASVMALSILIAKRYISAQPMFSLFIFICIGGIVYFLSMVILGFGNVKK